MPRLSVQGQVSFLVDTGADKTVLMPLDGQRLAIDYTKLNGNERTVGIGGFSVNFVEKALVVFLDSSNNVLCVYSIDLQISPPSPAIMDIPSLLGRDILNQWRMSYNERRDLLAFKVLSADFTFPVRP